MAATAPVMWDVVEEHLDEAAFLSVLWEAALESPFQTLASVAEGFEERLLAHVDGLLLAGEAAQARLLEPALAGDEPARAFAAALALLETPGPAGLDRVVARLEDAEPVVRAALVRALELARRPGVEGELSSLADPARPARIAAALTALAFRRVTVPAEVVLRSALTPSPEVLVAALRAAPLAGPNTLDLLERSARSPVPAVRDAALESGLVMGLRSAWAACQQAVDAREPGCAFALLALGIGGEPEDVARIVAAAAVEALRPAALFALGFTGRAEAAVACLPWLGDEKVARVAGEAFSAITGLAIDGDFRAPEPTAAEEPVPLEEEDLDADLVPGPEAALPLPAAEAVEAWWRGARGRLDAGARWLGGRPHDAESVQAALAGGPMRRRHALALELAVRSRGEVRVQTRGWARDQLRFHEERPLAAAPELTSPFGRLMRA